MNPLANKKLMAAKAAPIVKPVVKRHARGSVAALQAKSSTNGGNDTNMFKNHQKKKKRINNLIKKKK